MDFLLIVVAIGGFVVSIVMLVLASRANRLQKESDERVETLEAMATGSVLFASASPAEPVFEPAIASERAALPEQSPLADDLDFALNEFADEDELNPVGSAASERLAAPAPTGFAAPRRATFVAPTPGYPFVMTVPAAAGAGRVQVSFDRTRSRSRP